MKHSRISSSLGVHRLELIRRRGSGRRPNGRALHTQIGDSMTFYDFALENVEVAPGIALRVRHAGSGPSVVLLHGHPRTHTTWHQVAPLMVEAGFKVVCPDLRGYGQSSKPVPDNEHRIYCDRAMATDVVALMNALEEKRFAVIGHDRGSYVAYRTALDHPARVTHLAVLDGAPVVEALERADAHFAEGWWHWFFFASDHADRVINADPMAWYQPDPARMGVENYDDLVAAITNPATVRAMLDVAEVLMAPRQVSCAIARRRLRPVGGASS